MEKIDVKNEEIKCSMDGFHEQELEEFRQIFQSDGVEDIERRLEILKVFLATEEHITIDELFERLKKQGKDFSRDFVAQTMDIFINYGFAQKKSFNGYDTVFEHKHLGRHHDHLICLKCGKIVEFFNPHLERLQSQIAHQMGFANLHHRMEIYGLCDNCQKARRPEIPLAAAAPGEKVCISSLAGGRGIQTRLRDMGLTPGSELEVVSKDGGPVVVACRGSRLALGSGLCEKVMVRPLPNGRKETEVEGPDKKTGAIMSLDDLRTGERGRIIRLFGSGPFRKRLMEMGFVKGTVVEVKKYAPLKDPVEYVVKGYHVSLRHEEAAMIEVEKIDSNQ